MPSQPISELVHYISKFPVYETGLKIFYSERFVRSRDLIFITLVAFYGYDLAVSLFNRGPVYYLKLVGNSLRQRALSIFLSIPFLSSKVQGELIAGVEKMEAAGDFFPKDEVWCKVLPYEGLSEDEVLSKLSNYASRKEVDWESGKVSGSVYRAKGDDDEKILSEVMKLYGLSNILHPDMFPAVNKMEREIVGMVLNLYNAPAGAAGCFTMGGTESIIMACRTYKEQALKLRGITKPEMIVPITAHAAFDKASEYFGIELIHIPVDKDFKVNIKAVKRAINSNTILIAGSAMNYPHGIIDDIEALSKIAKDKGVGLHVDCCLGGFLIPFMAEAGFQLPSFDFQLEGVTSISCDTHKYGCTIKGSSVVLYRTRELFANQFHIYPDWTGGIYATHSIQGSRPGLLVAACWAALIKRGRKFYVQQAREVVGAAMSIKEGVRSTMPQLEILGNPLVSVVAIRAKDPSINSLNIADAMQKRGWALNKLQSPSSFHIACTARTVGLVDQFLLDLKESTQDVIDHPGKYNSDSSAFYGANAEMQGTGMNKQLLSAYLLGLLKI